MELLELIKEKICSMGHRLVGVTELWYPTYMVHLDFIKPNDDPMYPIDWAIMHFVKDMPKLDKSSVARIIGMETSLVEYRINCLCESGDLSYNSNFGLFQISDKGEHDYFAPDGSVMYISSNKDLLIDGNSLSIMDEKVYSHRSMIKSGYKSDIVENVTITKDGKPMRDLLKKLESMTNTNKEKLCIPANSKNFTTSDDPTFGSIKIYFVFSIDKKGDVCKNIFYIDDFITIPFYSKNIVKFYYDQNLNFNFGFTNYDIKDVKNRIFDLHHEKICEILQDLYRWKSVDRCFYIYKSESYHNSRPLSVVVTLDSYLHSNERKRLREDLRRGEVDYIYENSVITISVLTKDERLRELFKFGDYVEELYIKNDIPSLITWMLKSDIKQNRRNLIALERYDILEKIDNYMFIQEN